MAFGVLVWGMETPACVHMNGQLLGGDRHGDYGRKGIGSWGMKPERGNV